RRWSRRWASDSKETRETTSSAPRSYRRSSTACSPRGCCGARKRRAKRKRVFDWHDSAWYLRVPMISALFHQVSSPARLGALDLVEVLDWAEAALNRVDRDLFFKSFEEDYAVQYFYEPFLQAFDPELRKQLGVWYT